ncbi:MAG: vWA domain-containing protein [Ignavibacteriota bacterium]
MKIRFIRTVLLLPWLSSFLMLMSSLSFSQPRQKPRFALRTRSDYSIAVGTVVADSAYLRVTSGNGHSLKNLAADDFLITNENDTADIISALPHARSTMSDLGLTFILDNSASMYHSYDSLTKYLDQFLDSISEGITINAMAFDNVERKRTYDGTRREELYIASSEFTADKNTIKSFWHSYDSIRTELTPLYETIIKGLERIIDRRNRGDSLRTEIMIVVTDGADNASSVNIEKLSELVAVMPVTLFTVNFRNDPDGRMLWLAAKTFGDHYTASSLRELREILDYLRKDISYSYKVVFRFPFQGAGGGR